MITSLPKEKKTTAKPHSLASPLPQATLLVFSALLFHTPLIPWSQNFTAKEPRLDPLDKRWAEFINKSASKDYGLV